MLIDMTHTITPEISVCHGGDGMMEQVTIVDKT